MSDKVNATGTADDVRDALQFALLNLPTEGRLMEKEEFAQRTGLKLRALDELQTGGQVAHFKIGQKVRFHWPDAIASLKEHFGIGFPAASKEKGAGK